MSKIKIAATAAIMSSAMSVALPVLAQSAMSPNAAPPPVAKSAQPAPKPAADMQAVLDAQAKLGAKPVELLTPALARQLPTPADGVKAVMAKRGLPTALDNTVTTRDLAYGTDPLQTARVYMPAGSMGKGPLPVVIYYHGGGWVFANLDVYDATPRFMSKQLNAIVVSVEYRKAPEVKFPGQHEDAIAAYKWTLANAKSWGGDTARLAFAGESAGGNLAVATAIAARDGGMTMPRHILAVYPIANSSKMLPSRNDSFNAKPLNTPMLNWFSYYYSKTAADGQDPRINLVKANLRGLPPVTIVNAQIDPLRSDGETLATALRSAGVSVEQRTFPGVTHEFFGMGKVVKSAYDAESYAIARMKPALAR